MRRPWSEGSSRRSDRQRADAAARVSALAAAVFGLILMWPVWHVQQSPAQRTLERVESTESAGNRPARTTTSERSTTRTDNGIIEQLVQNRGVIALLRLLFLTAVAFICGAATQRIWLANFGIRLGPLDLRDPIEPEIFETAVGQIQTGLSESRRARG